MKLILVRHGQAEGNKTHTIMSRKDVGLTELGRQQAEELAGKLDKFGIGTVYSSPLHRALETIRPFADKLALAISTDDRLVEVDWGELTGQPEAASLQSFGKSIDGLYASLEYDLSEFGGESARQVESRVRDFLEDLKNTTNDTACVVTHDGIVHWFHYIIDGRKVGNIPNASIHEFSI